MPRLSVNGTELYYQEMGRGPPVVFSHGLLWSTQLYDSQVEALRGRYRCIAYDHRGQGRSAVPPECVIDMETVYQDAVALIETLGVGPCHFVGLSMGGFVGMRLAARRPDLLRSLVLLGTSADAEPLANVPRYALLNLIVRAMGMRPVVDPVMRTLFGRTFLRDPDRAEERALWRSRLLENRQDVWRAVNGLILRKGISHELPGIHVPTLILVGEEDVATVPAKARRINERIPGSRLQVVPRGGHTLTVEQPALVNASLGGFLDLQAGGMPGLGSRPSSTGTSSSFER